MALSTISGGSRTTIDSVHKPAAIKLSRRLLLSSLTALIAFITLIIAFSAPYWLASYKYTYSSFVRLGLWDFCFKDFRHPYYQFVDKFSGCYWIYNAKYHNIRDWLQPGWFILVQTMMVFALLFSLFSLITLAIILMLYFLRYQFIGIGISSFLQFLTAIVIAIAVIIFRVMAYDRSWLENPNHNHLDWAYYVAILSLLIHFFAGVLLLKEAMFSHRRRRKMNNLVYNMQPRSPRKFGSSINETTPMMLLETRDDKQRMTMNKEKHNFSIEQRPSSVATATTTHQPQQHQQQWPHFTQV